MVVELGRLRMVLRDLAALSENDVLELDQPVDRPQGVLDLADQPFRDHGTGGPHSPTGEEEQPPKGDDSILGGRVAVSHNRWW